METLIASLSLVVLGTLAGLSIKFLQGKGHKVANHEVVDLSRLPATQNGLPNAQLGSKATLLQFSTEYCGQCPGVRRQLARLAYRLGGLSHLEVDITERLDIAAHFKISQTPTVLLLDGRGEIVFRFGGLPNLQRLSQELERLGVK